MKYVIVELTGVEEGRDHEVTETLIRVLREKWPTVKLSSVQRWRWPWLTPLRLDALSEDERKAVLRAGAVHVGLGRRPGD